MTWNRRGTRDKDRQLPRSFALRGWRGVRSNERGSRMKLGLIFGRNNSMFSMLPRRERIARMMWLSKNRVDSRRVALCLEQEVREKAESVDVGASGELGEVLFHFHQ